MAEADASFVHGFADVPGARLHYVSAGSGPLVLLLHGFPEFWFSYRHQLPALAAAGYRAVAVDQRGYNLSSKPAGVSAYRVDNLAADTAALVQALGAAQATVVGHDWGGIVAWYTAMLHPGVVERLAILNVPHPARRPPSLPSLLRQIARSSYVYFFQLPRLPELLLSAGNFKIARDRWKHDPARPGAFTPEDLAQYVRALAQPGALTAGINYYRAAVRSFPLYQRYLRPITVPTLVIWGVRDRYLEAGLATPSSRWVPDCRVVFLPASHWVQNDCPDEVNRLLLEFLPRQTTSPT